MRTLLLFTLLAAGGFTDDANKWRADYEAKLRAPDGWLSLVGLQWLHEGVNHVDQLPAGVLRMQGKTVSWEPASGSPHALKLDEPFFIDGISLTIIERVGKLGARLRDPKAHTRTAFTAARWFPPSETWRVKARWVKYPQPKPIRITNILGMTDSEPSPGYAEFVIKGRTMRLQPVIEDDQLFFLFRDKTNAHETYGAGRFLYADMPKGNEVELDFNRTHNPPCAFTPYATCPLPPRQNTLPIAIEAGEKRYGAH